MNIAPIDKYLKHRAIISSINYNQNDGPYSFNTDVKALSLGKSTWDQSVISAKVWRHSKEKWNRASEELPLHRVLDLTILILSASIAKGEKYENYFLDLKIVDQDNLYMVRDYLMHNKIHLHERLQEINLLLMNYFEDNPI